MKVLSQDDNVYNILTADGREVSVAKKGLSDGRRSYFDDLANPSKMNAANVAAMDEVVEPKTGQVLGNVQAPQRNPSDLNMAQAAPEAAPNPDNFAIQQPEEQAPTAPQANPMQDYRDASMAEAQAVSNAQESQAQEYQGLVNQQTQIESEYNQRENELKAKQLEAEKQYREVSDEYFNSKEIDQGRFWSNASTGQKVMAGIGLALASLNPQAMKGALSAIDRAVERDIAAQKLEILKKKNKMGEAKGLLAKFDAKFKNLDAAESAAKMAALEKAKLKVEMIASNSKSEMAQAKAQKAIAELEMKMATEQAKLNKELAKNTVNIGGYKGTLNNPTEAKNFREAMNNLSTAETSINRLLEINEDTGKSLSPSLRAEAEVLQKSLIGLLRVPLTGPGAMNASEQALLERLVANPTDVFALDSSNKVKLKTLLKTLKSKANNEAKNLGLSKYAGVDFKAQ